MGPGECLLRDVLRIFPVPQDAVGNTKRQRARVTQTSLELQRRVVLRAR